MKLIKKRLIIKVFVLSLILVSSISFSKFLETKIVIKYERQIEILKSENLKISLESKKKLQTMKDQLVEDLSSKCEVLGVSEGSQNGKTILDTNDYYSRGKWMFQVKTIIYYYKKFYSKEITIDEAVLIAHTEEKARSLAYDIIWREIGGIWNWKNCSDKLRLDEKITIIRELEK